MANADIGRCDCPACGADAAVRENKKGRAYVMCDECNYQGFARGVKSDAALRARIKGQVAAAIEAGQVPQLKAPEPEAKPAPAAKPIGTVRTHSSEGETTIFDLLGKLGRGN